MVPSDQMTIYLSENEAVIFFEQIQKEFWNSVQEDDSLVDRFNNVFIPKVLSIWKLKMFQFLKENVTEREETVVLIEHQYHVISTVFFKGK